MVKVAVLIKQVPNTKQVKMDSKSGTLIRDGIELMMNPDDLNALEAAIEVKETFGGQIIAISMGPAQAKEVLYEAKAMGADKAYLLCDPHFKGADTYATAKTLVAALNKLGPFDLITTGVEAIDGNTAQLPYQIAQALKIPHITQFKSIQIENGYLITNRIKGHEFQHIKVKLPVLIAVNKQINRPRYYDLQRIHHAFDEVVEILDLKSLPLKEDECGQKGSPTQVIKISQISHKRQNQKLDGTDKELALKLIEILTRNNLLRT